MPSDSWSPLSAVLEVLILTKVSVLSVYTRHQQTPPDIALVQEKLPEPMSVGMGGHMSPCVHLAP